MNGILDAFETQRMAEAYGAAGKALGVVAALQHRMILTGPKRKGYNADGSTTAEPPLEELTDSDDDTPAPARTLAAAAPGRQLSRRVLGTAANPPLEGLTDSDEDEPPPAQAAAPPPLLRIKTTPVGELEQRPDSQTLQLQWRGDADVPELAQGAAKQPRDPRQQPVRRTPATRPSPGATRPGPQPAPPARPEAPAPPAAAAPGSTETAVQAGAGAEQQPPPRRSVRQRAERTRARSEEAPSLDA